MASVQVDLAVWAQQFVIMDGDLKWVVEESMPREEVHSHIYLGAEPRIGWRESETGHK